mgnify:CR=1 FL=1
MSRRRLGLLARLAASLCLLWVMVEQAGVEQLAATFSDLKLWPVAGVFVAYVVDSLVRAFNWHLLLAARNRHASLWSVFSSLVIGGFFGFFIPSSLGPDLARSVALGRREKMPIEEAASSVVMLNLTGLWALGAVVLVGLATVGIGFGAPNWWPALAVVGASAVIGIPVGLMSRISLPRWDASHGVAERVNRFSETLEEYREVRFQLVPAFLIAIVNQLMTALIFYLGFGAAGVWLHPLYLLVLAPAVTLSRLVPLSVAGFGMEQGVVVVLFAWAGAAAAEALTASLAISTVNLIFTAFGGLLYVGMTANRLTVSDTLAGVAPSEQTREISTKEPDE